VRRAAPLDEQAQISSSVWRVVAVASIRKMRPGGSTAVSMIASTAVPGRHHLVAGELR